MTDKQWYDLGVITFGRRKNWMNARAVRYGQIWNGFPKKRPRYKTLTHHSDKQEGSCVYLYSAFEEVLAEDNGPFTDAEYFYLERKRRKIASFKFMKYFAGELGYGYKNKEG